MVDIPTEKVDDALLGHGQLVDIKSYLQTLGRPILTDLALVLGILYPTMINLPNDEFLNRVITLWLNKADNVMSKGEPSWRTLVWGLRHDQIRQNRIANNIASDHCISNIQSQDVRVVQTQQQLREGEAEINRMQRELRDQTASSYESMTVMQSPPEKSVAAMWSPPQNVQPCPPSELTLKWRRLEDMPYAMWQPHAVIVNEIVYLGDRGKSNDILEYDPQTCKWNELPQYQCYNFTMTEVNHHLTLVGGWICGDGTSNAVSVFSASHRTWEQWYPPMNTPRELPAVFTYKHNLMVAGGIGPINHGRNDLATVEILDTSTPHSQWLSIITPLPIGGHGMSSVIIHDTVYLLGGSLHTQVFSMSLTQIGKSPTQWLTLPDAPLEHFTAITVHGYLLIVGGLHHTYTSNIYVYLQDKNIWTKTGDLPTERCSCACCLLPSGEILVAGGDSRESKSKRMDVAAIGDHCVPT